MISPNTIAPIIKLTEICNYSCHFCRYANHPQANCIIKVEDVKRILLETVKYNVSRGSAHVKVIFHGGEPLLWGLERFRTIMDYEEALSAEYEVRFVNSIQTNGYLLDERWVDLLKKNHFSVGISLDGPGDLNGHYGKEGNEESVSNVLANIHLLKHAEVPFGILSVITDAHTNHAKEFYEYWINNGIENVGLCFCYNPEDKETVDCQKLSTFLIELFDLYFYNRSKINIREFNNAIQRKMTKKAGICTFACREKCGHFLTIDSHMRVMFCDDYDLSKNSIIGNLSETGFEEIVVSEKYQHMVGQSHRIAVDKCCHCEVLDFCGTGCNRNDTSAENYFCPTYKALYSHISECLSDL